MKKLELNPLVSILMNCYNSSNYISNAIESVINQTYKNWELIIWDDGSTDETVKVISEFKDDRIKLFLQKNNLGLRASRIEATKEINGELVSILDSDDFFEKEKIFKQVDAFQKNKNISICGTWANFFDEKKRNYQSFQTNINNFDLKKRLLFINILPHSSIMYKREVALNSGWYSKDYEYSQDYDLTLKLIKNNEIHLIKEFMTNIVQHNNTMSNSLHLKRIRIQENIKILKNNLINFQTTKKESYLIKNIIQINLIKLALIDINKNFLISIFNIIKIILKNPLIIFKKNLIKNLLDIKNK